MEVTRLTTSVFFAYPIPPSRPHLRARRSAPVVMQAAHEARPGRTQLAKDVGQHARLLAKAPHAAQWAQHTAAALWRYNDAETAAERLPRNASLRQQQRAKRALVFELAQLCRTLQRVQNGDYGDLPAEDFAERLQLAQLAANLRKEELRQSAALVLAPSTARVEMPPAVLVWMQKAVEHSQQQRLDVTATAWLQTTDHIITAIVQTESRLANPRLLGKERDITSQELTAALDEMRQQLVTVPDTLNPLGWDVVARQALGYLSLRTAELS